MTCAKMKAKKAKIVYKYSFFEKYELKAISFKKDIWLWNMASKICTILPYFFQLLYELRVYVFD